MELNYKSILDIPVNIYNQLIDIKESKLDDIDKDIEAISILTGHSKEDIEDLKIFDIVDLKSQVDKLFKVTPKIGSEPKEITINGISHSITYEMDKMNVAQYVDFQNYLREGMSRNNISKMLSVICIPKGHRYNEGYDVNELQEKIESTVPYVIANRICFFFLKNLIGSIKALELSLAVTMMFRKKDPKTKEKIKEMKRRIKQMTNMTLQFGSI